MLSFVAGVEFPQKSANEDGDDQDGGDGGDDPLDVVALGRLSLWLLPTDVRRSPVARPLPRLLTVSEGITTAG